MIAVYKDVSDSKSGCIAFFLQKGNKILYVWRNNDHSTSVYKVNSLMWNACKSNKLAFLLVMGHDPANFWEFCTPRVLRLK